MCQRYQRERIEWGSSVGDQVVGLTDSCYLIRHGHDFMLWDTGFSAATTEAFKATPGEPLKAQLSHIGVEPKQISIIGISHWHPDHTGQAAQFSQARHGGRNRIQNRQRRQSAHRQVLETAYSFQF